MGAAASERASAGAALVTGAARRIGLAIAERLAGAGYDLAVHCGPGSQDEAETHAARFRAGGRRCVVLPADLGDPTAAGPLVNSAASAIGPLSLLVNSAAIFEPDEALAPIHFERHMAVNLRAPILLAAEFATLVPAGRGGAVVNIIDQRVLRPNPTFFSYGLSKAALWAATRTLAQALAERDIRVNAVGPGPVLPNRHAAEAGFEAEAATVPLGRAVQPDEIAEAVLYLAEARNVTGQMIAVDAGQHLGWETPDFLASVKQPER
jgi:NAD(P)-dependent dehydrogenase (short-subunit alcohol dehydrogenase family)